MSKTIAEWKEDLERAFNIMNEELLEAEYKARVDYYWKSMNEIMEEVAKETKSYKRLEEENKNLKDAMKELNNYNKFRIQENKKLKSDLAYERTMLDNVRAEYESLQNVNKNLKEDVEYFRQIYLDLKKMCEDDGYLLTDEEVTKLFNLDEIK